MAAAHFPAVCAHHHKMAFIPLSTGGSSGSRLVGLKTNRAGLFAVARSNLSRPLSSPTKSKWALLRTGENEVCGIALDLRRVRIPCREEYRRALRNGAFLSNCKASLGAEAAEVSPAPEEELSRGTLIWRAVKPPMYSVALIPCSVAAAAAYLHTGTFLASRYWITLLSGMLIIAWLNLSNDVFDHEAGVDGEKKESVVNMTGRVNEVYLAGNICLGLAAAGFSWAAQQTANWWIPALVGAAVACGLLYQAPPFRLCHKGLGEPLVFVATGCMTSAYYLGFAPVSGPQPLSLTIVGAAVLVSITTGLILFCSHFHQIEGDLRAGKISPLVRLGTLKGSNLVTGAVIALYTTVAVLVALRALPVACAVTSLLTMPVGKLVADFVRENHADKSKIFMAKYFVIRLHVAHGLALILGLLVGAWQPLLASW